MNIQAYLFFPGCCEEAIAFYRDALDAQVQMLMRYKESPEALPPGRVPPGYEEKVMHASLQVGDSVLMLSDGCADQPGFHGFSLSLSPADEAEAAGLFAALSAGGTVQMPLGRTFWSPAFAMVTDRFGVSWMINVAGEAAASG